MAVTGGAVPALPDRLARVVRVAWRLFVTTVDTCLRNRVTGLAAEAAFFAVLSLPPLIFGLAGSVGYVVAQFSHHQVDGVRATVLDLAGRVLTPQTVDSIIRPTLGQVLSGGRTDVISIGFLLALWSGSRAMNVFVDTITIMYGLSGRRGIVRTRMLSFGLYALGLVTGMVTLPLIVAGPTLVHRVLPTRLAGMDRLYWPVVLLLGICFLAALYHLSVPVRTGWRFNLPGACVTMTWWVVGSAVLRTVLVGTASRSTSIYGPLAAPIAILLWLYLLALAVLLGAAVNVACDTVWPQAETTRARLERFWRLESVLGWSARRPGPGAGADPVEIFGPATREDLEAQMRAEMDRDPGTSGRRGGPIELTRRKSG